MNFTEIVNLMNEQFTKTGKKPVGIKVNSAWIEKKFQQSFELRKAGENKLENLMGLPVHMDDSVDKFEFVYKD